MKNFTWFMSAITICIFSLAINAQTGWISQTNPLGISDDSMIGKVQFVSDVEGWISCGDGRLLHTTDGGQIWDIIDPFPTDTVERFSDPAITMSWVGNSHGWIIGTIGSLDEPRGAVIYYTTSFGQQWLKRVLSTEIGTMGVQLQFVDQNNGWILLYNFSTGTPTSLKTTDGGNTWIPFNGQGIFYFIDANNGWAYSGSGNGGVEPPYKIYRTTNGGTDWTQQFQDNSAGGYNAIMFSDLSNGWVVGDTGKVLKTTDGGTNWNFITNSGVNISENSKTVFFIDANTGWISSKQSDLFSTPFLQHTTNGGITWETQITPFGDLQASNAIFSIYFVNPQTGWITGDRGRIARYYGPTDVDNKVNSLYHFSLDQNYPNPFNPTTMISYHLASSGDVTLKLYDVLGNEVATLVDEFRNAGSYEVTFDASSLSSGIYFYKLQAGDFVETKKMILMK
jgi:photosystem II stability/assembly factor-like uncharacterized protein